MRARLTPRERQVLHLVARGTANRDIARALGIRPGTVRSHLRRIFVKLHVRDRDEAVAASLEPEDQGAEGPPAPQPAPSGVEGYPERCTPLSDFLPMPRPRTRP